MALESYQYQWNVNDNGLEFRDQDRGGNIKDVYRNGQKIGAYNTQTGHQYGLANTNTPMGLGVQSAYDIGGVDTGTLVKNQQLNVDSGIMNNSLLKSSLPTTNNQSSSQNSINPSRRDYISPEDVAKMTPSDNSSGKMIGSKIGAIVGAPLGFLAGGAAGSTGGPIGSVVGAGLGLAAGHKAGSKIGGDWDYFWKGLNETMQEQESLPTINNQSSTPTQSEQQSDPKKGYYISRATQNALSEINPNPPDLSTAEQVVDSIKTIKNALQGKSYEPDLYVAPKPVYIPQKDIKTMNQQQSEAYPAWITSNNPFNFNK